MNSTSQNGEKTGYRVILLLVVALAAFSSAMKELNQLQQLTLDASRLIAQLSDKLVPTEVPQIVVKKESCDSNEPVQQSPAAIELPWLDRQAAPGAVAPRHTQKIIIKKNLPKFSEAQIARLKKIPQIDIDPVEFEVRLLADHDERDGAIASELPVSMFKAKTRKHRVIRINPRDREMILKTLNRSINLRIAS
jgi:hypothetical protein